MSTIAWVSWVALVMVHSLTTSNPFTLAVVLLSVILVGVLAPKTETGVAGFRTLLFFGLTLLLMSILIAVINGNSGTHVLFTLPGPEFPSWMGGLALGGPVTAEGMVWAAIRGVTILTILLAFATFNGAISPHQVLRTTPAALFHAGLVVTIGLTLLPSSIEDARRVREMQALRGRKTGLRTLPALTVPTVIGGLERSMRLAEAMEARGYASRPPAPPWARLAGMAAAPAFLAAAALWIYGEGFGTLAAALAIAGIAGLVVWAVAASRLQRASRLTREYVPPAERVAALGSVALTVFLFLGATVGFHESAYNPFISFSWPEFTPLAAVLALAAAWPAIILMSRPQPARSHADPPLVTAAR